MNISEGKEEKYQFYKDLYQKVNKSLLHSKPNFKENYAPINSISPNKKFIPTPIRLHNKLIGYRNQNNNHIYTDENSFLFSSSGSNIKNAKPFNFEM